VRGKVAKAIRREARSQATGPTMWRRTPQITRIHAVDFGTGAVARKQTTGIIITPGTFRDCIKRLKENRRE
jgi:hypothetical protein